MFEEEIGLEALPKHSDYDHEINLIPGAKTPFQPIYPLSLQDLEEEVRGFVEQWEAKERQLENEGLIEHTTSTLKQA